MIRLGKPKTEVSYWDECNPNMRRWYMKGKWKCILRKRYINKRLKDIDNSNGNN